RIGAVGFTQLMINTRCEGFVILRSSFNYSNFVNALSYLSKLINVPQQCNYCGAASMLLPLSHVTCARNDPPSLNCTTTPVDGVIGPSLITALDNPSLLQSLM